MYMLKLCTARTGAVHGSKEGSCEGEGNHSLPMLRRKIHSTWQTGKGSNWNGLQTMHLW